MPEINRRRFVATLTNASTKVDKNDDKFANAQLRR
jgi:hypothetical protein